ncbi:MAG: anaerobic ribonucleoside-triphosphate reductase activating protein [Bacteroidales bacterium]|nr:anaerobic ribonucleoside-triphosphate reductase activating protein [Bacteroidales bacterium]
MKYYNYDIVFQEIPDETTLAFNITNCPCFCKECHSPFLAEDIGTPLTERTIDDILKKYLNGLTCVAFMGGDADVQTVNNLAKWVKTNYNLKTAWYSGREKLSDLFQARFFDYVKIGPYKPECGALDKPTTNQRLYRIKHINDTCELEDITAKFRK